MLNHALLVVPSKEAYVCRNPLHCKVRISGGHADEDSLLGLFLSIMFKERMGGRTWCSCGFTQRSAAQNVRAASVNGD